MASPSDKSGFSSADGIFYIGFIIFSVYLYRTSGTNAVLLLVAGWCLFLAFMKAVASAVDRKEK